MSGQLTGLSAILLAALAACAGPTPDRKESEEPVTVAAAASASEAAAVSDAEEVDEFDVGEEVEPEIAPEDLESEGFCTDDIYTKYLESRYRAEHVRPKSRNVVVVERRGRHKGRQQVRALSRRSIDRQYDLESLSWARGRMLGAESPYFGAIPVVVNDRVDFWIQYFKTAGRRQFMTWLVRGESLKRAVQPTLAGVGIPNEFFYLAMIESGFNNGAKSSARATGTWQFMSRTAQLYGLKINHWVDERRDPIKSTIAAANYLRDLYEELGDWHLAMAAYNSGPGKIERAIKRTGTRDFWRIAETPYVARETAHYVPKVLAALLLASQPHAHGFDVQPNPADEIPEAEVVVQRPVRLSEVASELGVAVGTMEFWNPELIRGVTPPGGKPYALRMPAPLAARFPEIQPRLAVLQITDVQMYRIRRGDTLARIAKQYKIGTRQILEMNPGIVPNRLKLGREIAIPVPGVVTTSRYRAEGGVSL